MLSFFHHSNILNLLIFFQHFSLKKEFYIKVRCLNLMEKKEAISRFNNNQKIFVEWIWIQMPGIFSADDRQKMNKNIFCWYKKRKKTDLISCLKLIVWSSLFLCYFSFSIGISVIIIIIISIISNNNNNNCIYYNSKLRYQITVVDSWQRYSQKKKKQQENRGLR